MYPMGEAATGMSAFITALQTTLTGANLWGEISGLAPWLASIVLFAFGYYVFRKSLKGVSKGKARI